MKDTQPECPNCGSKMKLKFASYGPFYGCTSFPSCRETLQSDSEGNPIYNQGDKELSTWRDLAHHYFDGLWRGGGMSRPEAYEFLSNALQLSPADSHIGQLDVADCKTLVKLIQRKQRDLRRQSRGLPRVSRDEALAVQEMSHRESMTERLSGSLVEAYDLFGAKECSTNESTA